MLKNNLTKRIIPCLDVKDGKVIKGVQFKSHRVVGDIEQLAQFYSEQSADELVFYDISASPEKRRVDHTWVERVARLINIPFCVAGGIRSVNDAEEILHAGADKISINTPALENPSLINELVSSFGQQCIVVGVDSIQTEHGYRVKQNTGDPDKSSFSNKRTMQWLSEVVDRGAGEVVLNCMNQDGVRKGYDIEQLKLARANCPIPLIASGGAGSMTHFYDVFNQANVDGALAASVFHTSMIAIPNLKKQLNQQQINIRL